MKEITYIHAEGFAAGELKHGSVALIDRDLPVIEIAPGDMMFEKTVSNMHEVIAREGRTVLITDRKGLSLASPGSWATLVLPEVPTLVAPLPAIAAFGLSHGAGPGDRRGQPRNLAKSVTVE